MNRNKQKGMSPITVLAMLAVAGFLLMFVFTLLPVYITNFNISSSVSGLANNPDIDPKSAADIKNSLMQNFAINDVSIIKRSDIIVTKQSKGPTLVSIVYEERRNLMANIDLVVSFDERVELQ